jgi:GNAT superfamily N-acetyltransferase
MARPWRLRRPTERDQGPLVERIDDWWGGRRMRAQLPRLWFREFGGTSWVAEAEGGRLVGFLVGFVSPDRPGTGVIHLVGVDPNRRRIGIGRSLIEAFADDVRTRGAASLSSVGWPGDRGAIAFHRALGFALDDGPGTTSIFGSPGVADYDGPGEDRVLFERTA